MPKFGQTDDEAIDQLGGATQLAPSMDLGPMGGFEDDESTEIVNSAEIGGFFGGRFRIDARLGAGAMGKVLTALDTETGQLVALKVLHRERSRDKNVLRRFAREAASLRAINHRAIVGIVASGRAPDGTPWLAMEHLQGQTLKARIAKQKLQPAEFWPVLKTLAEALGEAHARGVIHRDLKPENIFVPEGNDPPCKILDFGLSTLNREGADKVTATGQLLGTPRYMAPELLASIGKPDHRVDVFALAVMTFEALTGRSLYSADDLGSLFGQILEARTHSLRQFRPDLPEALEAVIKQGHARSMSDRFPNAGAFAQAFAQAAGIGDAIAATPALAGLFDEMPDGDGNAPLVDPFGAPARATGPSPLLPPLAADVPPLMSLARPAPHPGPPSNPSSSANRSPSTRSRVGTHLGVAPFTPPMGPVPNLSHSPAPRVPTPAQPIARGAVQVGMQATGAQAAGAQAMQTAGAQTTGAQAAGAQAMQTAGAQTTGAQTTGAQTTGAQTTGAQTAGAQTAGAHATGPVPLNQGAFGQSSVDAPGAFSGAPPPARAFTAPSNPRFSNAPAMAPAPSLPAEAATPSKRSYLVGCLAFGVLAVVVVVVAVALALGLRWMAARGAF